MNNASQPSPRLSASGLPSSRGSPAFQPSLSSQHPNVNLHQPSPLNPSVSASQYAHLQQQRRPGSRSSESSDSSQITALSIGGRPTVTATASSSSVHNPTRPSAQVIHAATHGYGDLGLRKSPRMASADHLGHRPRQHSQGFFEPSLPTASAVSGNLTASQIAAQAAMQQQQQSAQHARKRSQTVPNQQAPPPEPPTGRRKPNSPQLGQQSLQQQQGQYVQPGINTTHLHPQYQNGLLAPHTAATTAANVVFPRSAASSPGIVPPDHGQLASPVLQSAQLSEKETKQKSEKSKMKLFSKPKVIGISKDKDTDKKEKPLSSPNRLGLSNVNPIPRMASGSTINLVDSGSSTGAPSPYMLSNNASTSTLVPEKAVTAEKEKHKHNFLSRQKHRLKDDHYNLPLSSASSNSKPTDPNAPQSLYSFAPSSPGPSATAFAKSMSGLDLRHGGRALRERKKEEKASSALAAGASSSSLGLDLLRERDTSFDREWANPSSHGSTTTPSLLGPGTSGPVIDTAGLQGFGLSNMGPDDAWPFLKAKLMVIFEGEDLRMPVEDFNRLVSVHLQRCIQRRSPTTIIEDLRETLQTGFASIDQTLQHVPDDKIVPHLVETWLSLFSTILPYVQAVFLPLDLEFKGRGPLMTPREALEFWGLGAGVPTPGPANPSITAHRTSQSSGSGNTICKPNEPVNGEEHFQVLEVRRMVLISYRDTIILPRYDILKAIFSRLSLESINVGVPDDTSYSSTDSNASSPPSPSFSSSSFGYAHGAGAFDSAVGSYNSHGSGSGSGYGHQLHDPGSGLSSAGILSSPHRSRATSNTSAGAITRSRGGSGASQPPPQYAAQIVSHVAETVGRLLQCISVLAAIHSGDDAQTKMEALARELKHNWLGRARTGRNRRGFVATKVRPSPIMIQSGSFNGNGGGAVYAPGTDGMSDHHDDHADENSTSTTDNSEQDGSSYTYHIHQSNSAGTRDRGSNYATAHRRRGGSGPVTFPSTIGSTPSHDANSVDVDGASGIGSRSRTGSGTIRASRRNTRSSAYTDPSPGYRASVSSTQSQRQVQRPRDSQIGIARSHQDDNYVDGNDDRYHNHYHHPSHYSYDGTYADDYGYAYHHGPGYTSHRTTGSGGAGGGGSGGGGDGGDVSRSTSRTRRTRRRRSLSSERDGSPTPTPTRMPSLHNSTTTTSASSVSSAGQGQNSSQIPTSSPGPGPSSRTRTGTGTGTGTGTSSVSSVVFGSINAGGAASRRRGGSGGSGGSAGAGGSTASPRTFSSTPASYHRRGGSSVSSSSISSHRRASGPGPGGEASIESVRRGSML
ncbi:HbrB-domain-containing protein [Xylona heveae TC161]|uniref:HbrB-domain-containing protein n=1 Tax=Xylona heveae (strain CBS 132557 / TC161) TaxID=1328760 RepID=A0A165A2Y9_XYLHT|nr:HbrB-domain-containing protein [Xylona heveae TC161]KZF19882.1 HbrB-domain-containing protein [Xylona heveae TC161]